MHKIAYNIYCYFYLAFSTLLLSEKTGDKNRTEKMGWDTSSYSECYRLEENVYIVTASIYFFLSFPNHFTLCMM